MKVEFYILRDEEDRTQGRHYRRDKLQDLMEEFGEDAEGWYIERIETTTEEMKMNGNAGLARQIESQGIEALRD